MMEINLIEYLTEEQKEKIGEEIFIRVLEHCQAIEFKKSKIDINTCLQEDITNIFESGDIYENISTEKIGEAITKKVLSKI